MAEPNPPSNPTPRRRGPMPPVRPLGYAGPARQKRSQVLEEAEREAALWDWLTPVLMLIGSILALMFGPMLLAMQFDIETAAISGIVALFLAIVKTVVAVALAVAIALLWGSGFDSFWRDTLKLAAIVMTATAVTALLPCFGCFNLLIYVALIVSMLMGMMELDQGEAIGFAVTFIVIEIGVYVGILMVLG